MRSIGIGLGWLLFSTAPLCYADTCYYDGVEANGPQGNPEKFTGEYTCKDQDTHKVVLREQHVDGLKDGRYTKYDAHVGTIEEEGTYRHDQLSGVFKRYREGKLQMEIAYREGRPYGVQKDYEAGVLSRVYLVSSEGATDTEFSLNPKGQLTELTCGKGPIGNKDSAWCGRDGKRSTVSLYTSEGKLSRTEQYLFGKLDGTSKKFNVQSGEMMHEEQYEGGARKGETVAGKDGTLLYKSDCDSARRSCKETELFSDGKALAREVAWKNGKKARQTEYYQNGKIRIDIVSAGTKFTITEYYDSGKMLSRGEFIEASDWYWLPYLPDGLLESYDSDGTLSRKENFRAGRLQGLSQVFWKAEGHSVREDTTYDKELAAETKIYVDNVMIVESKFNPDGSLQSRKVHAKSPVKDLLI